MTEEEYQQLLRNQREAGDPSAANAAIPAKAEKRKANKWEREYGEVLQSRMDGGGILWYKFEAMRFRLADGAYYKPDYVALATSGETLAYEVKGHWRESARLRIKVAADQHPYRFIAVTKRKVSEGGGWDEECFCAKYTEITPRIKSFMERLDIIKKGKR